MLDLIIDWSGALLLAVVCACLSILAIVLTGAAVRALLPTKKASPTDKPRISDWAFDDEYR